jgi:hypothetical protein
VFTYREAQTEQGGAWAGWSVYGITDEGEILGGQLESPVSEWVWVAMDATPAMTRFGLVGQVMGDGGAPVSVKVIHTLDRATMHYDTRVEGLD